MAKDDFFGKIGDFLNKSTQSLKDRLTMDVTDLIRAIDQNSPEEVERALNAGVDPNALDGADRLPLAMAIDRNNERIVRLLLDAGAKVSPLDSNGESPLFKAVSWENEAIVELLLAAGADIHQANRNQQTPLGEAQQKGYAKIKQLLEEFYDEARNQQVKADRAKHEALKEKARRIQKERAEEERQHQEAEMAEQLAAEKAAKARTEKAVLKKYRFDQDNWLDVCTNAIRQKDELGAKVLLEKALEQQQLDADQRVRLLLEAIRSELSVAIHLLLEAGVDALAVVKGEDHSPLSLAVSKNAYRLVEVLLAQNAEKARAFLNEPEQMISLQFVAYKDPRMLDILMTAGADPFFGGKEVPAPVVKAVEKASIGILPVLARHRVDLNRLINEKTLLEWAIHFDKPDWVVGLIAEGVDLDLRNANGQTPLELAQALGERAAIVEALSN
ncbi:MAG: ankyrin repeat domain-containing protein [Bacteroidota bacterium]